MKPSVEVHTNNKWLNFLTQGHLTHDPTTLRMAMGFYSFIYSFKRSLWSACCVADSVLNAGNRDEASAAHSLLKEGRHGNLKYYKIRVLDAIIEMHDKVWEKEILWCRVEHLQNSREQPSQKLLWDGCPVEGLGGSQGRIWTHLSWLCRRLALLLQCALHIANRAIILNAHIIVLMLCCVPPTGSPSLEESNQNIIA